jgi:isoleucyl-tRNA synthetase
VILAEFVTTESGTGAVHIAPGHGADDYLAGQQNDLGLLSPVDDEGRFTDEVGVDSLVGEHVLESNIPIIKLLAGKGALIGKEKYKHSYPHCWRSKTPIIFRSVPQFFIRIDELRETALKEIDKVEWLPHWGRNRIYGTVESRPDWCISRQRTWGVPLPVFYPPGEAVPNIDADLARKVADLTEEGGTNLWFEKDDAWWAEKLGLPEGTKRCTDTLDVWIDSGSSHVAVMDRHPELSCPADLYLEATDQHRGWFQSSLMLSTAVRDAAPYKSVMTHGFVVRRATKEENDKRKQQGMEPVKNLKVSKSDESGGKPMNAAHFYNKFGADIVRLWAGSVDWQNEVPFSEDIFKQTAEPYRRFRNILRILLANLKGFDPDKDAVANDQLPLIDWWILERLHDVERECQEAYEAFEFRKVFNTLNQFCASDLSAFYVDITKDRMYCDAEDSVRRRATQTAMHRVFHSLVKLIAPILAYTADEAWEYAGNKTSVHLEVFPTPDPRFAHNEAGDSIEQLSRLRDLAQVAIDAAVKDDQFKKRERAAVTFALPLDDPARAVLEKVPEEALEFLMVSSFSVTDGGGAASALVNETSEEECPRCRRSLPLVEGDGLCGRCSSVMENWQEPAS